MLSPKRASQHQVQNKTRVGNRRRQKPDQVRTKHKQKYDLVILCSFHIQSLQDMTRYNASVDSYRELQVGEETDFGWGELWGWGGGVVAGVGLSVSLGRRESGEYVT